LDQGDWLHLEKLARLHIDRCGCPNAPTGDLEQFQRPFNE